MPGTSNRRLCAATAALLLGATLPCRAGADFADEPASLDVRDAASWALATEDNAGRPFAIVDKREARLYLFDAGGRLLGASAVLLGLARGDEALPGSAQRVPANLAPFERTTPAGRFASQPGHNHLGEAIVWFDYDAALAVHRLRPAPAHEQRPERLASASPDDNRISAGCVVVPVAFYDALVAPTLGRQRGVVYVLPEAGARWALQALRAVPQL